jgi:hypothetical protein
MRARAWLFIPLGWAISCGGRYLETGETSYEVAGGTSSVGGSVSTQGGKSSGSAGKAPGGKGGAGAGGNAKGGTMNTGVAGSCACDPIACAPGYSPVPNAGGCCFHCEVDLARCATARENHAQFRRQVIEKYSSLGCQVDSYCSLYYEMNQCGSFCGVAMPTRLLKELDAVLNADAEQNCWADCPPIPTPPCEPPSVPLCRDGVCR